MMHVPYADGQRGRDSFQDFGNDSGNEGGMGDFVGFDGDWAGEDGADDTQDPFSNELVAAPRKVSTIPYSQFVKISCSEPTFHPPTVVPYPSSLLESPLNVNWRENIIVTCRPDLSVIFFIQGVSK